MLTFTICLCLSALLAVNAQKEPLTAAQRCDLVAAGGKACSPDACRSATCNIVPSAICLSDQCGCRARFFSLANDPRTEPVERNYAEVTSFCKAGADIDAAKGSLQTVLSTEERAADIVSENPAILKDVFRGLNTFIGDVMKIVVHYAKQLSERKPNSATFQRYNTLLDLQQDLQKKLKDAVSNDESVFLMDESGQLYKITDDEQSDASADVQEF
ncbi:uncharacterized protein LOC129582795 [Paramacrobiotus metropolitanus]|uniref:uncharacterized protein LOC129582795 n=1 Tax=Paramacrobiotus metropolitanus TaxID=2943436 RepID=UPI0024459203|nr:uncharacterized protein LOC129582795 [Paramacrobiotus metropolitanus]